MTAPRNVHLVGSVPLGDTAEVFRTCGSTLGELLRRYPDGEIGNGRENWVRWLRPVVENHPAFDLEEDKGERRYFRLKPGTCATNLVFGEIGYAAAAKASYRQFTRARAEGVIPRDARFQVSIPTPLAFVNSFVVAEERLAVEPAYVESLLAELAEIVASIPSRDLAVQWDAVIEILILEGARPAYGDVGLDELAARLIRLVEAIPAEVEAGLHLCYGDFNHQHIVQPKDARIMVGLLNAVCAAASRRLTFAHMPVPRSRDDIEYFEPLRDLKTDGAELCLGLVHYSDGVEGTRKRMATAARVVRDFTIGAECGFGRRPRETIVPLLEIHRDAARGNH